MKIGSYKFVLASTPAAVNEMLVKKSADYAGRPQTYAFYTQTLGRLLLVYCNEIDNRVSTTFRLFSQVHNKPQNVWLDIRVI